MGENNSRSPSRRTFLKGAGAGSVLLGAGLAGCLQSITGGGGGTHTLGVLYPTSGPLPGLGQRMVNGVKLAQSKVNEAGIAGGELELVVDDTQLSPQAGVSAAQKQVNQDGVPAILGPGASSVTLPVAKSVTMSAEIPLISQATTVSLTDLDDGGYVLRTAPSDAFEGAALAKLIADEGTDSVAIVHLNDSFGTGLSNVVKSRLEGEYGGTVTDMVGFAPETFTASSVLSSAMSSDPDGLVFVAFAENLLSLLREAFQRGLKDRVQYFGPSSTNSADIIDNIDAKAINGMLGTDPSPPVNSDRWDTFLSDYQSEFGGETDAFAGYTYDATMLAALAIESAGESSPQAIRDSIYSVSRPEGTEVSGFQEGKDALESGDSVNYQGATGSVDLDDAGDVPGQYRRWVVEDGEYQYQGFVDL